MTVKYSDVSRGDYGSAGASAAPNGTNGSVPAAIKTLFGIVSPPHADSTALSASLAKNRVDAMLTVKVDDYTLWVWKAGSSTGASATVIAPTDVGIGVGRWVKLV